MFTPLRFIFQINQEKEFIFSVYSFIYEWQKESRSEPQGVKCHYVQPDDFWYVWSDKFYLSNITHRNWLSFMKLVVRWLYLGEWWRGECNYDRACTGSCCGFQCTCLTQFSLSVAAYMVTADSSAVMFCQSIQWIAFNREGGARSKTGEYGSPSQLSWFMGPVRL